jgi:hypothetical protein
MITHMKKFNSLIRLMKNAVASEIVSASCWERIDRTAALVSADISGFFGFERRLDQRDGEVDFVFHVTRKTGGEKILLKDIDAGNYGARSAVWRRVHAFADLWNTENSSLNLGGDNVWLEFDTAGQKDSPPLQEPSIFFGPREEYVKKNGYRWIIDEVLPAMTGTPISRASSGILERAFEDLPAGAGIYQIGSMLTRPVPSIRFCVRGLSAGKIIPYLNGLGWKDDGTGLESLIDELAPLTDWIDYAFDLIEKKGTFELGSKIGLEGRVQMSKEYPERWKAVLEKAEDLGLCGAKLREKLLTCDGLVAMTPRTRKSWPEHLVACDAYLSPDLNASLAMFLHHLKIVYDKDAPQERLVAKVYLAVKVFWRLDGKDSAAKKKVRERLLKEAPKESLSLFFRTEVPDFERIAAPTP